MFAFRKDFLMKNLKFKHLSLEDRYAIQEYLNLGFTFTAIENMIGKSRRTISKEVFKHRIFRSKLASDLIPCPLTSKPPYVCNACSKKASCKKIKYTYDASSAHNDYLNVLINTRANLKISKEQIADINDFIAPLMIHKHHSINHLYISHPEFLPFAKSTFYKYIDLGILNVKNIDLQRKVRFKTKKEHDVNYSNNIANPKIKIGRFYRDFQDYIELHPNASIVEMDTVIGTAGGKGGKCMLTLLFRSSNLMLIYLLPYKQSKYVSEVFNDLRNKLGDEEYSRLFEVILTDNGTEFSDPLSIEVNPTTGEKLVNVFYCNPNCSWQKGSIEKNHEYIRYVLPKGTSFAGLDQNDCYLLASHINSIPRVSLNNCSPYKAAWLFIGQKNLDNFHLTEIDFDSVNCSPSLLSK